MTMAGSIAVTSQVQGLASCGHRSLQAVETGRWRPSFVGVALKQNGWTCAPVCKSKAVGSPRAMLEKTVQSHPNFYELLGLAQDVALPDIKLAYRQMAKKFHPDVCPVDQSQECAMKFIEVQEAYETLSDPRRRAIYDMDMANSFSAIASGRRRYADSESGEWRSQWENQVSGLKRRAAVKDVEEPETWGAKMRRRRQQQQQQQQ